MSHSRTHRHTAKPPKEVRQAQQRQKARERREAELLRERYTDADPPPEPDAPRYRP